MVEARVMPVTRVVTIAALIAAAAIVRIILFVAIKTGRGWRREGPVLMAVETGGFNMFAEQRVVRRIVIKLGLQPLGWLVAGRAVIAHCAVVRLIVLVAVGTSRWRIAILYVRFVTVGTLRFLVRAEQFEICKTVIKSRFVNNHNNGVTSYVFGMTGGTLVGLNFSALAVESCFGLDIGCDVLMAIEAQKFLTLFVKHLVAICALGFEFRMPCNDLAGHHQGLNVLGHCNLRSHLCQHYNNPGQNEQPPIHCLQSIALVHVYGENMKQSGNNEQYE